MKRLGSKAAVALWLERYALLLLMLGAALFFSVYGPTSGVFPTAANVRTILANQSVLAIVAIAALVPLVCREFDLSVGAVLGLSSIATATAFSDWGMGIVLAALVGIGVGATVGLVNGVLVTRFGIDSLIATLGSGTIVTALVIGITGGKSIIKGIPAEMMAFGSGQTLGVPRPVLALVLVAGAVYYVLAHTPLGRYLYAIGSNPSAARLVGMDVAKLVLLSFVASGALAGAAGVLQITRIGSGNPQVGPTFTLPALAAAFLSAAAIRPGRFNVMGALVAVFFLATLTSGLNLAGVDAWINDAVNGAALLIGVGLATFLGRQRAVTA